MEADVPVSERVLASRYRIGALLGRGGMAEVYDGYDERLHRAVAVKLLRPDMAADPGIRSRFEVEARAAAGLSHPNLVAVYDTGEDAGTPFIVMERLPGETLADRMAAGPVEQAWLARVAGDVLGALGAAHAAGVVHRDVKPGNILLAADGCAKVADFGIAKSAEVAADVTGTGLLVGTPAYLAPERVEGRPATPRSDLYSLGVVLYEALAGMKPFDGTNSVVTADAVLHHRARPLHELRPDVDPSLVAAIERSMAKDPAARPASARDMADALRGRAPTPAAADPTVPLAGAGPGADRTLVGASLASVPGEGSAAVPAPGASGPRTVPGGWWRGAVDHPSAKPVVVVAAILTGLLLLAALVGGGGTDSDAASGAVAASIRDLAGRVRNGDGPKGGEAAERLATVADQVEAGGGSDEANALLADAGRWNAEGALSDAATTEMAAVLGRIDGVDPSVVTTTTTVPTTLAPPVPVEHDDDEEGERRKGKGKGRGD